MRILVTGASGFIGGVVCRRAIEQGHEVTALVRRPGSGPPGTAALSGDLVAPGGLEQALAAARPECVVHLAAEIASQRDAAKVTEVNIEGTRRLLDACRALDAGTAPEAGTERGPTPTEAGTERGPTPTEAGTERGPTPTEAGTERGPTPTEAGTERGPTPTEAGTERRPTPTEAGTERRPTPTEAGTERRPTPTEAGTERRPTPKFIFASTVVTGDAHGELLTEDGSLPVETPYGRAKQEGERMVLESGLPAVVIRPSHVYGPGGWYGEELVPRLRQPGRFAVIGSGANLWDVVHVEDVATAILLAVADEAASGRVYHVADDEPITYYDFMALTASELGVGRPRRIPTSVARLVAGRNAVDAVVRSARTSNARIKSELGWEPRFPTAREGVPDAVARLLAASAAS